jgi:hypothetical protein
MLHLDTGRRRWRFALDLPGCRWVVSGPWRKNVLEYDQKTRRRDRYDDLDGKNKMGELCCVSPVVAERQPEMTVRYAAGNVTSIQVRHCAGA